MNRKIKTLAIFSLIVLLVGMSPNPSSSVYAQADEEPLPMADLEGTFDLKAVPRPPDGTISEWQAGSTSTTIVYRYPSSIHGRDDIVQFYVDTLPGLDWTWESRGGKTFEQSVEDHLLYYTYEGPQPLYTLKLEVRKDATVHIYVTHAQHEPNDLSLFVDHSLELGQDEPGAYDLKVVPRPPESVIDDWSADRESVTIVYRYNWEKYGRDDVVQFYVDTLPGLGWVWEPKGGKTLEQSMRERRLYYRYEGSHPVYGLTLEVRKDRTVYIYVTYAQRELEDLSLFVDHVLDLGQDMPGAYDLKAVPRPPESVIAKWKAERNSVSIVYRYNWEKYDRDDIVQFYVDVLPNFDWVWEPRGGKTLEQSMAERRLYYRYEGQMALDGLLVEVRKERTVYIYVTHGARDLGDFDLFSLDSDVVVDLDVEVEAEQEVDVEVNLEQGTGAGGGQTIVEGGDQIIIEGGDQAGAGGGVMLTPAPTPTLPVPFQHVQVMDQACTQDGLYFTLRIEKPPYYPPMDYLGVAFSVMNQDSRFVQVAPVIDPTTAGQTREDRLSVQAFATNGQSLMDTESLTGTIETAAAGIYEALIQPMAQPAVKYQVGWVSPRIAGERFDLLVRVGGKVGVPFGVVVQPLADPAGPLPLTSADIAVVCEP